MEYIQKSMEDDFAQVVGIGLGMWLLIIFILLISGLIGQPTLCFTRCTPKLKTFFCQLGAIFPISGMGGQSEFHLQCWGLLY